MDPGVVRRYLQRLAECGVAPLPFVLIGVAPLRSARSARWIRDKLYGTVIPDAFIDRLEAAKDPEAEGQSICLEVIAALSEIPQVAGCHVMAPGHDEAVPPVIAAARQNVARLRSG